MPGSLSTSLRRHCCFSRLQLADKQLERAKQLIATRKREDVETALVPLDCALELYPDWETALELKARALLYLKRFKDVVEMLYEFLPSLNPQRQLIPSEEAPVSPSSNSKEKTRLLSDYLPEKEIQKLPALRSYKRFSVAKLREKFSAKLRKGNERRQWRYVVLGQACCHLGMMEDAMLLLQSGKRTASAASRRQSNCMRDDNFCLDNNNMSGPESDLVHQMLFNIKFLLRRRAAALAALEAGLYAESVRHFSKIIEGKKGAPQGFIADCYLHRAVAYQATGKVVDAVADCNRNLALNPHCTRALSVRASLYEMVKCFSECLLDLQQLKMIYEAALRYQMVRGSGWSIRQQDTLDTDFAGGLEYINSKITATRQRLSKSCSLDAHTILDLPRHCSMEDVERAYLLISLKHRPDKAAQFVDRCEIVDDRDVESVKEEAKASGARLSQLLHRAYTKLLASISEEEEREKQNDLLMAVQSCRDRRSEWHTRPAVKNLDDQEDASSCSSSQDMEAAKVYACDWEADEVVSCNLDAHQPTIVSDSGFGCNGGSKRISTENAVMEAFTGFHSTNDQSSRRVTEELCAMLNLDQGGGGKTNAIGDLSQFNGGAGLSSSDLANAISQALCNERPMAASTWISNPEWSLPHVHPLRVT